MCWGWGREGQLGYGVLGPFATPAEVLDIREGTAVSAGGFHTCGLLATGKLGCWGAGGYGQLGDGSMSKASAPVIVSDVTDATAVSAGGGHRCGMLATGQIACWD